MIYVTSFVNPAQALSAAGAACKRLQPVAQRTAICHMVDKELYSTNCKSSQ